MSYLLANNTINGAMGSVVVTLDGRNFQVASLKNIEAHVNLQTQDMKVVGTTKVQAKPAGAALTGKGTIYYGFDFFREMAIKYSQSGVLTPFTIQITNSDEASGLGTQTVALYNCTVSGDIIIAMLNADESMLEYDFEFAYERAEVLQSFNEPAAYGNN